jgi:hypothetical protein
MNSQAKSGSCKTGADVGMFLRATNAVVASSPQLGEGYDNRPIVADEVTIIAGKAKERTHRVDRFGYRPLDDCLDLELVHGDVVRGYDVAQVRHRAGAKGALGPLDEEPVLQEHREGQLNMAQVLGA